MSIQDNVTREQVISSTATTFGAALAAMAEEDAREVLRRVIKMAPTAVVVHRPPSPLSAPREGTVADRVLKVLKDAPDGLTTPEIAERMNDGTVAAHLREPLLRLRNRGKAATLGKRGNLTVWGAT